jgi:chromosome partitioning protein
MIVVVAALKGGVGKTTTSVYLSALASSNRRRITLIDADPQGSAADWLEGTEDPALEHIDLVEAPTERLLTRALDKITADDIAIVDTPPGHDRLLGKAFDRTDVVVVPTRVGGVETPRVEAVLAMVPDKVASGLVICSARTHTRDYLDVLTAWAEAKVSVWGSIPERVAIASGPIGALSEDGLEAYKAVWRRVSRARRGT